MIVPLNLLVRAYIRMYKILYVAIMCVDVHLIVNSSKHTVDGSDFNISWTVSQYNKQC